MRSLKRANILLLYTDQQRTDTLGCYGNKHAITPNIDSLAKKGVTFEKYFVQSPICTPSRVSLLSGQYCSSHGVGANGITVSEKLLTINKILKPYGYHTANIGKLHFLPHSYRDHRGYHPTYGFDRIIISDEPGCYDDAYSKWIEMLAPDKLHLTRTGLPSQAKRYNKPEYSKRPRDPHTPYAFETDEDLSHTAFVASETIRYLDERKSHQEPFFCISGFYAPHAPINPPQELVDLYKVEDMRVPLKGPDEPWAERLKGITREEWQNIRRYYLAFVTQVDKWVGEIIAKLKENGQYEDTIIVFTSDHGEYLGDHGRVQKGMPGEDVITNVPCIFHYGDNLPVKKIGELCESVDILPTLLDMIGIQTPPEAQGMSLVPIIHSGAKGKECILTELFEPHGLRETTIRDKRYRYYLNSNGEEKLFDLERDPAELKNEITSKEYQEVLSELRLKMIKKVQMASYPNLEKLVAY